MGTTPPPMIQWKFVNGLPVPDVEETARLDRAWARECRRHRAYAAIAVAAAFVGVLAAALLRLARTLEEIP